MVMGSGVKRRERERGLAVDERGMKGQSKEPFCITQSIGEEWKCGGLWKESEKQSRDF